MVFKVMMQSSHDTYLVDLHITSIILYLYFGHRFTFFLLYFDWFDTFLQKKKKQEGKYETTYFLIFFKTTKIRFSIISATIKTEKGIRKKSGTLSHFLFAYSCHHVLKCVSHKQCRIFRLTGFF